MYDVVAYVIAGAYEAPIWLFLACECYLNLLEPLPVSVYSCIMSEIGASQSWEKFKGARTKHRIR